MNISDQIAKLRNEKWELISHIDSCFNFIKANPHNADLYIADGKRDTTKILEIELEIVNLEREHIDGKLDWAAEHGINP